MIDSQLDSSLTFPHRLSDDERQRHLVKKKNEELRLRQEGRFEEMGQLISKLPKVRFILQPILVVVFPHMFSKQRKTVSNQG